VPVVVLAYDADIDSFSAAITRGASAYLVKPVAAEEVVAVAHKISGGSAPATARRSAAPPAPLLMRVDVEVAGREGAVPGRSWT